MYQSDPLTAYASDYGTNRKTAGMGDYAYDPSTLSAPPSGYQWQPGGQAGIMPTLVAVKHSANWGMIALFVGGAFALSMFSGGKAKLPMVV